MARNDYHSIKHRILHEKVLEGLATTDPALHAELVELRGLSPQKYRKRIRKLMRAGAKPADFSRYEPLPINQEYRSDDVKSVRDANRGRDPHLAQRLKQARSKALEGAVQPDTSVLNKSIGELRQALESGAFDAMLDLLIEAESAGAARKGALKVLSERKS